jgi:hypothetical protein
VHRSARIATKSFDISPRRAPDSPRRILLVARAQASRLAPRL